MQVSTIDQMRGLDQMAIKEYGIEDLILMENAGHGVFEVMDREIGVRGRYFVICCGAGNNGGDGFVVARKIHANGGRVSVVLLGNPQSYRGSAKVYNFFSTIPTELASLSCSMYSLMLTIRLTQLI